MANTKISITSDLKVIMQPVFDKTNENGSGRKSENYDRNNKTDKGVFLSDRSKRKIKRLMAAYMHELKDKKSKLLWVTLTVPDFVCKDEIYRPNFHDKKIQIKFKMWIENLVKNYKLKNYIWVAERQKNNKIHFHVVMEFSEYINYKFLNAYWLYLLSSLNIQVYTTDKIKVNNYIKSVTKGLNYSSSSIIRDDIIYKVYNDEIDVKDLNKVKVKEDNYYKILKNPVQIKEVYDIKGLGSYMTKYITKNDDIIYCRNWASSREISKLITKVNISNQEFTELIQLANVHDVKEVIIKDSEGQAILVNGDPIKVTVILFDYSDYDKLEQYYRNKLKSNIYEKSDC